MTFTSACGLAGDHAEQRALADARAGEDADALAAADRQHAVDGAHARLQRLVDQLALERVRRLGSERHALLRFELALAVDRVAEPVQHAAEQARADVDAERAAERLHAAARVQPVHLAERHQQHAALVEADDLGEARSFVDQAGDAAELAEPDVEAGRLDHQADDAGDPAEVAEARDTSPAARFARASSIGVRQPAVDALERGVDAPVDDALASFDHAAAGSDGRSRRSQRASRSSRSPRAECRSTAPDRSQAR